MRFGAEGESHERRVGARNTPYKRRKGVRNAVGLRAGVRHSKVSLSKWYLFVFFESARKVFSKKFVGQVKLCAHDIVAPFKK